MNRKRMSKKRFCQNKRKRRNQLRNPPEIREADPEARIVKRIRSYRGADDSWKVNSYVSRNITHLITARNISAAVRHAVDYIGVDSLGFTSADVGTHSIRSGAAMALQLSGVPPHLIKLLGRWKSDSFLCYIRKQVLELSQGVSQRMISVEKFYTIEDLHLDSGLVDRIPIFHSNWF